MAVPKYDELYLTLLNALADGKAHPIKELRSSIAEQLNLSQEDLQQTIGSGQSTFANRLGWCSTYLKSAGLLEKPGKRCWVITEEGKQLLNKHPVQIDNAYLTAHYPKFKDFLKTPRQESTLSTESESVSDETPEIIVEETVNKINQALADEILSTIMNQESYLFEKLVGKLLEKMGYGVPRVTDRTNDGGIDAVITGDRLGFDRIFVQAKRYSANVQRPEVQAFSGALAMAHASKGLFITTSDFSHGAKECAKALNIVLVNGEMLAKLMIEYNLGVSTYKTYELKSLDTDFFNNLE